MNKFKYILLLTLTFAFCLNGRAQTVLNFQVSPELSDSDVQTLVSQYKGVSLNDLKAEFGGVKADQPVKDAIAGLPSQWLAITRTQAQIGDTRLWRIGNKAINLTGSPEYEFIYLANSAPLAVSDSNCILAITSAMMQLTDGNDDALFGVIVHEMAHAIFAVESIETKKQFNAALKLKDYAKAETFRKHLAIIEIKCDLIAGRMMLEAKYKVARYADLQIKLQQIEEELKIPRSVQWHPGGEVRKQALIGLVDNAKIARK